MFSGRYNNDIDERSKLKTALGFPHFFTKVKKEFRNIDRSIYPSIESYSDDQLYDHGQWLSPGGYLMLHIIGEKLNIKKGSRILDLGCGNGQSSIYFAKEFDADVVAVDLWIDASKRDARAVKEGVKDKIKNITADLRIGLAKVKGKFDYIISVQAFHCFGVNDDLMSNLKMLLVKDGKIGIIQSTFSKPQELPNVFLSSNGWETDYETYFYPDWWKGHFEKHDYNIIECVELEQGKQIWEENILYFGNRKNWSGTYYESHGWLMEHVLYEKNGFYLTHFFLTATNNP